MTVTDLQRGSIRAGELYGDFWFNGDPVPVSALRGQVILIHFWDYTCIHCHRTLPYIREWRRKYKDYGLVVIGVHTPKFPFGRDPGAVQRALERLKIEHPVVMDNESLIAARYGSRVWPSVYLVDRDGFLRLQSTGEGDYGAVEHAIQSLLYDAGVDTDLPLPMEALRAEDRPGAICYRATPELFTGYIRGSIGNVEGYSPESAVNYHDPGLYIDGRFYADGIWMNERNSVRFEGEPGQTGHLVLSYRGSEVSAVLRPEGPACCEVEVRLDGCPVGVEDCGDDLLAKPDGTKYVILDEARSYHLLRTREFGEHVLRLTTSSRGCSVYSFTCVSCVIPELIATS
jgi:thiol-disulfide isomerase/thioredoxin